MEDEVERCNNIDISGFAAYFLLIMPL